jgi:hypothetical protein
MLNPLTLISFISFGKLPGESYLSILFKYIYKGHDRVVFKSSFIWGAIKLALHME